MLKTLRKIKFINLFFRGILRGSDRAFSSSLSFLIARWPTSGIIPCHFDGVDFKMYNRCDDGSINDIYYGKKYDEETDLKFFSLLAKHSKTIVDIGANTGIFSIMASVINRSASIYAIEPYYPNYQRLCRNIELNKCSNIKPVQLAMSNKRGGVEFTVPSDGSITEVSSANGEFSKAKLPQVKWHVQTVQADTIDNYATANIDGYIDLIKCDVETYEMVVFEGMDKILSSHSATILFECFLEENRKAFFDNVLAKYNYHLYTVLSDGIVHLQNGFERTTGLNYLLSPVRPIRTFVSYRELSANPALVMKRAIENGKHY